VLGHHPAQASQLDLGYRSVAGRGTEADGNGRRRQCQVAGVEIDGAAVVVDHDLLGCITLGSGLGVVDPHQPQFVDAVGQARGAEREGPIAAGGGGRKQAVQQEVHLADAGGDVRSREAGRAA
jgi:hypothetical protein